MPDFAQDETDFAEVGVVGRAVEVGVERLKQRGFVRRERVRQLAELRVAEPQRAGGASLEEGTLTLEESDRGVEAIWIHTGAVRRAAVAAVLPVRDWPGTQS
jgi:hypothetical protein